MQGCSTFCICRSHPRYRAKRKPRTSCETCWLLWIAYDPDCFRRVVAFNLIEAFFDRKQGHKL